ncbi:carbohydrate ABC transporter permease [Cohnella fermenti]|uniref:Sugar ABC transporter permease n=1 Tax=Cohnella fermenti TaxID=2565925 RepID=A0A4S4BKL6_9BACL|nr:sugar ABC transporter permease [Cohnella fermenti]THF72681.1 sugar ABC transporter permease [Cohnella fermenti]
MNTESRSFWRRHRDALIAYSIIGPFALWFLLTIGIPLVAGILLAFFKWNGMPVMPEWVGLRNFSFFFNSNEYLSSIWKQLFIGGLCLIFNMLISFGLASLFNIPIRGKGLLRTAYYLPNIAAVSATVAVVVALLIPHGGGLNGLLTKLGLEPIIWSYSAGWMIFWVVVFYVWRNTGPLAIIWLAGLQSIDPTLYEAAKVDGANRLQLLRYVTLPGLRGIAAFNFIREIIGVMQMYDIVMLMTSGGPNGSTDVLMYRIYRDGLKSYNFGMAGASSVILGLLTVLITLVYLRLFLKEEK